MDGTRIAGFIAAAVVTVQISAAVVMGIRNRIRGRKAFQTALRTGQRWKNRNGDILEIGERLRSGIFIIRIRSRHGVATWGETEEKWREQIIDRRVTLVTDAPI